MIQKYSISILILFSVMLAGTTAAQLDRNNLAHFNELDGTIIYDVLADQSGNIWMSTQNGLVRYDGYDYIRYHPDINDSTTIGTILTHSLYENEYGEIFIGSMDAIYIYNPETKSFTSYSYTQLTDFSISAQPVIRGVTPDGRGRVYFGVYSFVGEEASHALVYWDESAREMRRFDYPDSINLTNVVSLDLDLSGNVWVVSFSGIYKIDSQNQIHRALEIESLNLAENEFIYRVEVDHIGSFWFLSNDSKLYNMDPLTGHVESWSLRKIFDVDMDNFGTSDLIFDSENNVWMGTNLGLVMLNSEQKKFEIFDESQVSALIYPQVNCLAFDAFDNLWMGTQSDGLIKYNDRSLLESLVYRIDDEHSISSGWITKIFETSDGLVWFSSGAMGENSGLNAYDPESGLITTSYYRSLFPGNQYVNIIGEIFPGEILVDTFEDSLSLLNTSDFSSRKFNYTGLDIGIHYFDVYNDSKGNTWFCTDTGLLLGNKNGIVSHFDLTTFPGTNASSNEVSHVFESKKNRLWITTNNGLFLYDYSTQSISREGFDVEKGEVLPGQDINSFYEDDNGIAWIGLWQGGLIRYDPETKKIKTYTLEDGLPSMSIQGILSDEQNKTLWLSTFEGISRFEIEEEVFTNFSLADGIQGLLFADGSLYRSPKGLFIFGGSNGITYFYPETISKKSIPPNVFVTDVKIDNESFYKLVDSSNTITFSFDQNNISINYVGIQYDNASKNRYAYQLENYDKIVREVGNQRTAFYYNLPPGKYTFRVNASNSNGVWNEQGATLNIVIDPPWWKTLWAYIIYGLLFIGAIIAFDRLQRRRLIEKARNVAKEKELEQAKEIEKAYTELKATQTQLIHAEKMASLGELTAGIAHEIQNPLNFVNNFSEVSVDLIEEMNEEVDNKNIEEVKNISGDLKQNLEMIHHHGMRASSIVKGMLEHSRVGNGEKELTDINVLTDEYLRLAYHGLRAKDKSFNADFRLVEDENLPLVPVVPQDIGRVLLNLINNAFFTVSKKEKREIEGYVPEVVVITNNLKDKIEIIVKDNGDGIPADVIEKIFQPFFTTKPTGQGTGLGLSMSYDIITNGHKGKLEVRTKEGIGTEFIIILPV